MVDSWHTIITGSLITGRQLTTENTLETFLFKRLGHVFGIEKVHRQFNVGGFLGLKSDIDLGNGQVGIELKVANKLTASEMQRLIGQVLYYKNRFYHDRLVLLIAGKIDVNPTINELKNFIEDLGVRVIYLKTVKI